MADIQHSNLTDPYLHEPKGVASSPEGYVYVADGVGSGIWRKIRTEELDYVVASFTIPVEQIPPADIPLNGSALSATTNGILTDASTFTTTNKNIKELYEAVTRNQQRDANDAANIHNIFQVLMDIKNQLDTLGFTNG